MASPTNPPTNGIPVSSKWKSRVVVFAFFAWIALFGLGALWVSLRLPKNAEIRESPFRSWDGSWEGKLESFDSEGQLVSREEVKGEYRHVPADKEFRQEGHFEATDAQTGEISDERSLSSASFERKDLRRKTYKNMGSVMILMDGTLNEDGSITWKRNIPGAKESFREWIEGGTLHLEGTALYGDGDAVTTTTFQGEYRRSDPGTAG